MNNQPDLCTACEYWLYCTATVLYCAAVQYPPVQGAGGQDGQGGLAGHQVGSWGQE